MQARDGEAVTRAMGTVHRVGGGGVVGWPGVGPVDAHLRHLLLQGGHDAPGGALETALQRTARGRRSIVLLFIVILHIQSLSRGFGPQRM